VIGGMVHGRGLPLLTIQCRWFSVGPTRSLAQRGQAGACPTILHAPRSHHITRPAAWRGALLRARFDGPRIFPLSHHPPYAPRSRPIAGKRELAPPFFTPHGPSQHHPSRRVEGRAPACPFRRSGDVPNDPSPAPRDAVPARRGQAGACPSIFHAPRSAATSSAHPVFGDAVGLGRAGGHRLTLRALEPDGDHRGRGGKAPGCTRGAGSSWGRLKMTACRCPRTTGSANPPP
jgi:hypothetical protein